MKGALLTDKQKGYGGYGFIPYLPFYFPLVLREATSLQGASHTPFKA